MNKWVRRAFLGIALALLLPAVGSHLPQAANIPLAKTILTTPVVSAVCVGCNNGTCKGQTGTHCCCSTHCTGGGCSCADWCTASCDQCELQNCQTCTTSLDVTGPRIASMGEIRQSWLPAPDAIGFSYTSEARAALEGRSLILSLIVDDVTTDCHQKDKHVALPPMVDIGVHGNGNEGDVTFEYTGKFTVAAHKITLDLVFQPDKAHQKARRLVAVVLEDGSAKVTETEL